MGGDGTPEGAGRCLVEGWDVINERNLLYTDQRLFNEHRLDEAWDVAPLSALTTPTNDRRDIVYLDVWEREVDAAEDREQLVNPAIGIETCVRLKREWVVRVAEGANAPPAAPKGHVFYVLAQLFRPARLEDITALQITDRRLTGLTVVSLAAEIAAARGTRGSFGERLDQVLTGEGQLKPQVV